MLDAGGLRKTADRAAHVRGDLIAFALPTASFGLLVAALGKTPEVTRGRAILATLLLVMLGGASVPSFIFPDWLPSGRAVLAVGVLQRDLAASKDEQIATLQLNARSGLSCSREGRTRSPPS